MPVDAGNTAMFQTMRDDHTGPVQHGFRMRPLVNVSDEIHGGQSRSCHRQASSRKHPRNTWRAGFIDTGAVREDPPHVGFCFDFYMGSRAYGVVRGGNLNNGANAGPFNVNVNNSFSNANVNNGARVDSSRPAILGIRRTHSLSVRLKAYRSVMRLELITPTRWIVFRAVS